MADAEAGCGADRRRHPDGPPRGRADWHRRASRAATRRRAAWTQRHGGARSVGFRPGGGPRRSRTRSAPASRRRASSRGRSRAPATCQLRALPRGGRVRPLRRRAVARRDQGDHRRHRHHLQPDHHPHRRRAAHAARHLGDRRLRAREGRHAGHRHERHAHHRGHRREDGRAQDPAHLGLGRLPDRRGARRVPRPARLLRRRRSRASRSPSATASACRST